MVCYYFLSVVPLSKQKTVTQITAHFDPFTTTLQNGPIWFRFSAATVVFSCGSFEAGHVGGITCRSCPPRCYPHKYVSWLAPNMPGNLPGIASGRSNKENHGKKKKRDPAFFTDDPHACCGKGFFRRASWEVWKSSQLMSMSRSSSHHYHPPPLSKLRDFSPCFQHQAPRLRFAHGFRLGCRRWKTWLVVVQKLCVFQMFFMCLLMLHSPKLTFSPLKIRLS